MNWQLIALKRYSTGKHISLVAYYMYAGLILQVCWYYRCDGFDTTGVPVLQLCWFGTNAGAIETDVAVGVRDDVTPRPGPPRRLRHHAAQPRRDPAALAPSEPGHQRRHGRRGTPARRRAPTRRTASPPAAAAAPPCTRSQRLPEGRHGCQRVGV